MNPSCRLQELRGNREGYKRNAPKDVGRENDAGTEHKASNRSSNFLEIDPIRPDVGDAIALPLETVQAPAGEALFNNGLVLRTLG